MFHFGPGGIFGAPDDKPVKLCGRIYGYYDENGEPIKRTPHTHPYNFDGYVEWQKSAKVAPKESVYSDRIYEWDYDKAKRTFKEAFPEGGDFANSPEKTEKWLRLYFDKENLVLCRIMKYCNWSNGYPCWRFDFK